MRRILLKWEYLMLGCTLLLLASCAGTKHLVPTPGSEGMSLGNDEYLFPNAKGELEAGKLDNPKGKLPAGVLIILPKTKDEVITRLKAAGAKIAEPDKK